MRVIQVDNSIGVFIVRWKTKDLEGLMKKKKFSFCVAFAGGGGRNDKD